MSAAAMQNCYSSERSCETAERLQALIQVVRFFHGRGWTPATSSNFSCRDADSATVFHISASGLDKGELDVQDFITLNLHDDPHISPPECSPDRKPSAETRLHALIYRLYPKVGVVLHCHSVNGTVLSRLHEKRGGIDFEQFEILKAFEGIRTHEARLRLPVFPNDQDMHRLSSVVETALTHTDVAEREIEQAPGFMLSGHGLYAWGETIAQARRHMEAFEFLFEVTLKLRLYD